MEGDGGGGGGVEAWMQNLLNDLGWLSKGGWGGGGRIKKLGGWDAPPPPSMNLSAVCRHDEEVELESAKPLATFLRRMEHCAENIPSFRRTNTTCSSRSTSSEIRACAI